jgi:phosphohistidine phosphatase
MAVMEGLGPLDDVKAIAARIIHEPDLMLVGHLPFMERLASYLITGSIEMKVFKFQNGGIVCLDRESESGDWFIKWVLMPSIK